MVVDALSVWRTEIIAFRYSRIEIPSKKVFLMGSNQLVP